MMIRPIIAVMAVAMAMGATCVRGAAPVVTNIAMFPSLSVAYTNYTQGFNDGVNYSRLAITHGGTNGAVTFASQAAGTAGTSGRPFQFNGASVHFSGIQELGYPAWMTNSDAYVTNIFLTNLTTGFNDVLTVPSGKRFYLWSSTYGTTNAIAGTTTNYVKIDGSYYLASTSIALSTNGTFSTMSVPINANETYVVSPSYTGAHAWITGFIYGTTASPGAFRFTNVVSGNNTIYTAPADKYFYPHGSPVLPPGNSGALTFVNMTAGTIIYQVYIVPQGMAADSTTFYRGLSSSPGTIGTQSFAILPPGTSVIVNSSSNAAGQLIYIVGTEL